MTASDIRLMCISLYFNYSPFLSPFFSPFSFVLLATDADEKRLDASEDLSKHPLIRLISEWRSHTHLAPVLSSILGAKVKMFSILNDCFGQTNCRAVSL